MFKKICAVMLAMVCVLHGPVWSWAGEETMLGEHTWLEAGERYVCVEGTEPSMYEVVDMETFDVLSLLFMEDTIPNGLQDIYVDTIIDTEDPSLGEIKEVVCNTTTNEVRWAGVISDLNGTETNLIVGSIGRTAICGMLYGDPSFAAVEEFMGFVHEGAQEEDSLTQEDAQSSSERTIEDYAGYYDIELMGERDEHIQCVLTEQGHGRLKNSSGSVCFDFSVENGRFQEEENDIQAQYLEEGRLLVTLEGMEITFLERDLPAQAQSLAGTWECCEFRITGSIVDRDDLQRRGISVDVCFHENGTADWHAITDSESLVAMGWGEDSGGLFMDNGSEKARMTLAEDGRLELVYSGDTPMSYLFECTAKEN